MIVTVHFTDFIDAFRKYDRYDAFGYDALRVIYDYLEELDPDFELDVIGICCDYAVNDWETIAQDYSIDLSDCADDEEKEETVREWLQNNTSLLGETKDGFVYCSAF